ncbi:MAG: O-antigen ligase family protein [Candidatus Komeilibacteria bacterium]
MISLISPLPLVLLGSLLLLALAIICWRSTLWGVYGLTFLLPSYLIRFRLFSLPTTVLECAIILVFLIWLWRIKIWQQIKLRGPRFNRLTPALRWCLTLILISATISAFISPAQTAAWGIWKAYFLEPLMVFLVALYTIQTRRQIITVCRILGLWIIILFPLACWQYFTGLWIPKIYWALAVTRRVTTIFGYPNGTSLFIAPIIALMAGLLTQTREKRWQIFYAAVIILGLLIIIWAKTAGALIALAAVGLYLLWHNKKTRPLAVILSLLAVISITFYLTSAGFQTQRQHIGQNTLTLTSTSLEIRLDQWQESINMLSDHWLLGAGLAGYQTMLIPYHQHDFIEIFLYPHNILLNFWSELGLLGLIAFGWLLIYLLKALWPQLKKPDAIALGLFLAYLVIIIHGLVDVPYFRNDLSALFFLLTAISLILLHPKELIPTTDN